MTRRRAACYARSRFHAAALFAAVLLVGAPTLADQPSDGWITTKVRMRLLTASGTDALDLKVDSVEGRVTLQGTVESERNRARAAALARKVEGVTGVRNQLVVEPETPSAGDGVPRHGAPSRSRP